MLLISTLVWQSLIPPAQHQVFQVDRAEVRIYADRQAMGRGAAERVGGIIMSQLQAQEFVRIVFASAPSQNEFLEHLVRQPGIPWQRVEAYHMDEYIGIDPASRQSFGQFLIDRLAAHVPLKNFHRLNPLAEDVAAECQRYAELLQAAPLDLVCMGIGENGHLAFNDPPVADFDDPLAVKQVEMDHMSRQQQVNDGAFAQVNEVPRTAMTLTIPVLMSARYLSLVVPGPAKQNAVQKTLEGSIEVACPASIIRQHEHAVLHLDQDAAALLSEAAAFTGERDSRPTR